MDVSSLLKSLLSEINNRDTDTIQRHLDTIEKAIHSKIDGFIDLKYAGSVSKHTYVDGLSDIDSLAILNDSELAGFSPEEVKNYFYKMLCQRLPKTKISVGNLAVTIEFNSGFVVQVLPVLKDVNGIKIQSSRRDNEWSHID